MGIARRWVFPIIRIIVFVVIALALVKLAFFSGATTAADPTLPTGEITQPEIAVATGTITNNVSLKANVVADPAVPVRATLAGEVKKVLVSQGQPVAAATPVLTIRSETTADDGTAVVKTVTVLAGSVGILSSFPVIVGQLVSVGDAVGQVAPPTFSLSGTLAAEKQYRLLNRPTEALVSITGGPAPFTCTGLGISTALAGAAGSDTSGDSGASTPGGTTVRCAVPAEITVFPGLAATLTISGGVAKDVLVVPTTAVEGTTQTGLVYTLKSDGSTAKVPVTLGLTDGTNVQVVTGLKAGDKILQFIPGAIAENPANLNCSTDGNGNSVCQGIGG